MAKKLVIAGGGLVLNDRDELLMIFRRGKWDLPKGKLDEGESIEACAIREVQEETGLRQVSMDGLAGITRHEYFDKYLQTDVIKETHWFLMRADGEQTLVPQTEEDISVIEWADDKKLAVMLEDTYPNIRQIIQEKYL